jgi:peptide/nickel transport system permease protein
VLVGGAVGGIIGGLIVGLLCMAIVFSYSYEDKQDPFTSRVALEEVNFDETRTEYFLRQVANFGMNIRVIVRIVVRNKVGFAGFLGVMFFILVLGLGPLFIEYEGRAQMDRLEPGAQTLFQPPSRDFLLGLDHRGRSVVSHIVYGGQAPIFTSIQAALLSTVIAVLLGAVAALIGGLTDQGLIALANFVLAVPLFPLLLVMSTILPLSNSILIWMLALFTWPSLMRSVRAQVLSLRERDYIEASFALDLGLPHIISREIFPNLVSYIAVNFILSIRAIMYSVIGLILVGVVPFREPDWGAMIGVARTQGAFYSQDGYMMALAPMLAIALFQLSLVLFARSLEEIFNPRLRALD